MHSSSLLSTMSRNTLAISTLPLTHISNGAFIHFVLPSLFFSSRFLLVQTMSDQICSDIVRCRFVFHFSSSTMSVGKSAQTGHRLARATLSPGRSSLTQPELQDICTAANSPMSKLFVWLLSSMYFRKKMTEK